MSATDKELFVISDYGLIFWSTLENVLLAEMHINRNFILRGEACLNEFLDFLGVEHLANGNDIGWEQYIGEAYYGYKFIDFYHEPVRLNGNRHATRICMPFEPHSLTEDSLSELFV